MADPTEKPVPPIGATRDLGHALAAAFLGRDWTVIGTVRGGGTKPHERATTSGGRLEMETVAVTVPDQVASPRARLRSRVFVGAAPPPA